MTRLYIYGVALIIIAGLGVALWVQNSPARENGGEEFSQSPVTSGDVVEPGSAVHDLPVPQGVARAREAFADELGIATSSVLVLEAHEKEWPDACLGLPREDEVCAQVVTPGYDVLLRAQSKERRYRTNEDGSVVREASE